MYSWRPTRTVAIESKITINSTPQNRLTIFPLIAQASLRRILLMRERSSLTATRKIRRSLAPGKSRGSYQHDLSSLLTLEDRFYTLNKFFGQFNHSTSSTHGNEIWSIVIEMFTRNAVTSIHIFFADKYVSLLLSIVRKIMHIIK